MGPVFVRQPNRTVFDISRRKVVNDVSLLCIAQAYPPPAYAWFKEVYINDINGCHYQRGQMLFYYEDLPDQLRLEDRDFEADKWHPMVHYA